MAALLDEGAGYAARGRFAEASRQARNSYFTEQRRADSGGTLRDAGSADPEADASFVYHGDPRRRYQLDTATDRLTNVLTGSIRTDPEGSWRHRRTRRPVRRRRPAGAARHSRTAAPLGCGRGPGSGGDHIAAGRADAAHWWRDTPPVARGRGRGDPDGHRPGGVDGRG